VRWWVDDLPPMTGLLRVVFYGGLLVLALRQFSPLTVDVAYQTYPPELRTPIQLFRLVGLDNPSPVVLSVATATCLVAWVFAAIGFLTAPSMIVTAATALFLHGIGRSMVDAHVWLVPVYTLLCLSTSRCGDTYSVDALIRRRWPWWPGAARPGSVSASGFSRKLVTLAVVYTLFAGGVAKLMEGGWRWADGTSLQFYVGATPELYGQPARFGFLASALAPYLWPFTLMSVATLLFELGSPLALFSRRLRHVIAAGSLVFHAGIYALMLPNFAAQAWCCILIVDWPAVRGAFATSRSTIVNGRAVAAAVSATALALLSLGVIVARVEEWPLTNVPMYSSRVSESTVSGVPRRDFASLDGLARLSELDQKGQLPWASRWLFWPRLDVVLSGATGERSIKNVLAAPPGPTRYRWTQLLDRMLLQELRAGDAGVTLDTAAVMTLLVERARALGVPVENYATVALVYRTDAGPEPVFSMAIPSSPR
jgi:hypothetical protein